MNRRSFLSLFGLSVAGLALEQAIPHGRVWSFPKDIRINKFQHGFDGITPAVYEDKMVPAGVNVRIVDISVWQARNGDITIFPPLGTKGPKIQFYSAEEMAVIFQVPTRMLKPPDMSNPDTQDFFRFIRA